MMVAKVTLEGWEDVLYTLLTLTRANVAWFKENGLLDIYDGTFLYKLEKNDRCGSARWQRLKQILRQPGPPYLLSCEEAGPLLQAYLIASGEDKDARLRLIQFDETAHVQVVSKGKVLDPSVRMGMPIPKGLEKKIYDLNFWYEELSK